MIPMIQMKTLYPNLILNDGIMSDLSDFSVPWIDDITTELDLGYYQHSAQKIASPLLFDISGNAENIRNLLPIQPLTQQQRTRVAGMLYTIFNRKWQRLYSVYTAEYNPIENYSMVENETIGKDISRAASDTGTVSTADTGTISDSGTDGGTVTSSRTGTVTNTKTGTVSNQGTETGTVTSVSDKDTTNTGTQINAGTSNVENGIFGFNSSDSVSSDTSDETNSNTRTDNLASTEDMTNTETRNLSNGNTETNNITEQESDNITEQETRQLTNGNTRTLNTTNQETRNLASSETIADDTDRHLTRSGNIGVTTSQQMLQSDIDLWQWNFFKQVFDDIDSILCLSVY